MGYGISTYLVGIARNDQSLENTLRAYGDGIAVVAQHIAKDHILERLLIILLGNIKGHIPDGTKLIGVLLVGLKLLGAETAGVGTRSINLISFLLSQIHHSVAGVKTARKGDDDFLFFHISYCVLYSLLLMA